MEIWYNCYMAISEKAAKKLGEVLAFAVVGKETIEKAPAYTSVFSEHNDHFQTYEKHANQLQDLAQELGVSEIVMQKLEGTGAKLRTMRDTYVGDEWDNAMEIMEWLGFFEGAAIVHWKLVHGTAQKSNDPVLLALAEDAISFHEEILRGVGVKISENAPA